MLQPRVSKLAAILAIVILCLPSVIAIGISPGKHTTNFASNAYEKVNIKILNNEQKEMAVLLSVSGDLKDYVKIKDEIVIMQPADESYDTYYEINLPEKIEKPGNQEVRITAMEMSAKKDNKDASVLVTTAVVSQLFIRVPYPDKYAEIGEISVLDSEVGKSPRFIIPVTNLGQRQILHAKAIVDILGPTNEKLASIESDDKPINSLDKTELVAQLNKNLNPGKYYTVINIKYDGNTAKKDKEFEIGDLMLEVLDVNVKDFNLGSVAKFNILVESKWNEKIDNAYVALKITDKNNNVVGDGKSANKNIEPLSKAEMNVFWDTEGITAGNYDAELTINYKDKSKSKKMKLQVTSDSIGIGEFGTGRVVAEESGFSRNTLLAVLVVVLIIINIGWFIYTRRKKQNNNI